MQGYCFSPDVLESTFEYWVEARSFFRSVVYAAVILRYSLIPLGS